MCVLTNKIYKISNWIFILLPGSCPRGGNLGCWGSKPLTGFAMALHWLGILVICCFQAFSPNWPSTIVLSVFYEIMSIFIFNKFCKCSVITNNTHSINEWKELIRSIGGGGGGYIIRFSLIMMLCKLSRKTWLINISSQTKILNYYIMDILVHFASALE